MASSDDDGVPMMQIGNEPMICGKRKRKCKHEANAKSDSPDVVALSQKAMEQVTAQGNLSKVQGNTTAAGSDSDDSDDSDDDVPISHPVWFTNSQGGKNKATKSTQSDTDKFIQKNQDRNTIKSFLYRVKDHPYYGLTPKEMKPDEFRSLADKLLKLAEKGKIGEVPFAMSEERVIAELQKLVNASPENTTGVYSGQNSNGNNCYGYHMQVDLNDKMWESAPDAGAYDCVFVVTTNPVQALMAGLAGPGDWVSTKPLPNLYKQLKKNESFGESFANIVHLVEVKGVKPTGELTVKDGPQLRFRIYIETAPKGNQCNPPKLSIEPDWPEILAIVVMLLQFSLPKYGIAISRAHEAAVEAHTAQVYADKSTHRKEDRSGVLQNRASRHKSGFEAIVTKAFICPRLSKLLELVATVWEEDSNLSLPTDYAAIQVHVERLLKLVKRHGIEKALGAFIDEFDLVKRGYTPANILALTTTAGLFGVQHYITHDMGYVAADSAECKLRKDQLNFNTREAYATATKIFTEIGMKHIGHDFGNHEDSDENEIENGPELDDSFVAHELMGNVEPKEMLLFWILRNFNGQVKYVSDLALALMRPVSMALHHLIAVEGLIQYLLLEQQISPQFMLVMLKLCPNFRCKNGASVEQVMRDASKLYGGSSGKISDLLKRVEQIFRDITNPTHEQTPAILLWNALKDMNATEPQQGKFHSLWKMWDRLENVNDDLMAMLKLELKDVFPQERLTLPNKILQHYFVAVMVSSFASNFPIPSLLPPSVLVTVLCRETDQSVPVLTLAQEFTQITERAHPDNVEYLYDPNAGAMVLTASKPLVSVNPNKTSSDNHLSTEAPDCIRMEIDEEKVESCDARHDPEDLNPDEDMADVISDDDLQDDDSEEWEEDEDEDEDEYEDEDEDEEEDEEEEYDSDSSENHDGIFDAQDPKLKKKGWQSLCGKYCEGNYFQCKQHELECKECIRLLKAKRRHKTK